MNKKKSSSSSGLLAILLIVMSFLISWLWITPNYKQNQADVAVVTGEYNQIKAKLDSLTKSKAAINQLGATVDSILIAVPKDADTGNTITSLEAIATANETYIPSFQISGGTASTVATTQVAGSSNVTISFSVSGAFEKLNAFVAAVEKNLKVFNVKSMSVAANDKGELAMTLELEAFTQQKDVAAQTVESTTPLQ